MTSQTLKPAKRGSRDETKSQRGVHIFACILVALTVGLIAAGAMVTSTGSGLSVPDWPTTYGENMFLYHPSKWVGGIFYEHGHRLLAASIGFLTIILAVLAQWRGRTPVVRRLGWVALAAVIAQGILGGMTVKFMLPTWISVFHACLAQTFLCILVTIAVLTHSRWNAPRTTPSTSVTERRPSALRIAPPALVVVVFAQLIAGALMRHTQSGLAVPDFPLAYGQVVPDLTADAVMAYNDTRAFDYQMNPVTRLQIVFHLIHRAGAILVVIAVVAAAASMRKKNGVVPAARQSIAWIIFFVTIQVTLGAFTIWSEKLPAVATAHVAVGAATLAMAWRCFLVSRLSPAHRAISTRASVVDDDIAIAGALA